MKHAVVLFALLISTSAARSEAFDDYSSVHLLQLAASDKVQRVKRLERDGLVNAFAVLPKTEGALLIVHTNDNRWAKLLVQPAKQKIDGENSVPILLIERFVTFKEGEERAFVAEGKNIRLFHDFRFNLDIGAIVPEKALPNKAFTADLRFVDDNGVTYVEPLGKAELFVVKKHLPEAAPPKGTKIVVNGKFDKAFFAGDYKLYDDGKKASDLHVEVGPKGNVRGWLFSGATGAKYDVQGQIGPNPMHGIQFSVTLPRSLQTFTGWMFTADASAITGFSNLEGREAGFYALRVE
jgi:hypothetical protein